MVLSPVDMGTIDQQAATLEATGAWYDLVALHCAASPERRAFFAPLEAECPCPPVQS
jgi:hypothetical protein